MKTSRPTLHGSDRSETSFLVELARRTGCGLLIHVNNIYVNALNRRLAGRQADPLKDCRDWLNSIPLQFVGELHVAGHLHCGNIVIDDNGSLVDDAVWALYSHALDRFEAVPVRVEWDTAVPPFEVLLGQVACARAVRAARARAIQPADAFAA